MIGILASFIGATLQAINYLLTQDAQYRYKIRGLHLLIGSQIVLGIIGFLCLLSFGYLSLLDISLLIPLLKVNLPYIIGQYALIKAIQESDASVASPLLALKVPALALMYMVLFHQHFTLIQWIAMTLIISLAYFFSSLSGKIKFKPLLYITIASFSYGTSDLFITDLSQQLPADTLTERALITNCINYFFCGMVSLPIFFSMKISTKQVWQLKWVGLAWFVAVFFLIIGFNLSGVVGSNVVQSSRGVMAVILGLYFFKETRKDPTLMKKLCGAVGMCLGITLFYI